MAHIIPIVATLLTTTASATLEAHAAVAGLPVAVGSLVAALGVVAASPVVAHVVVESPWVDVDDLT